MAPWRLEHVVFALVTVLLKRPASCSGSETRYGIVFDAGSSGSRVHVYSYRSGHDVGEFDLVEDLLKKAKPGLSAHKEDPIAAAFSLTGLLRYAEEKVPKSEHARTPVFLMASAGLRAIRQEESEAILKSVRSLFRHSPFLFEDEWAYIMSGREEGIFGWVTVNYLLGALNDTSSSTGVIDLGGGSAQLVYHMPLGAQGPQDYSGEVHHGGRKHNLYVGTFPGHGLDRARDRLLEHLQTESVDSLEHPCVSAGLKFERTGRARVKDSYVGTGHFHECQAHYRALFDKNVACGAPPCSFGGIFQPALPERIFGFSYLYDRTRAIGLLEGKVEMFGTQNMSIEDIEGAAQEICSMTPSDAAARFAECEDADKWENFCGDATYLSVLLDHGFGIDRSTKLTMGNKLGDVEIVWTLGAIIAKSGALKARQAEGSKIGSARSRSGDDDIYPKIKRMMDDQSAKQQKKQEL